MSVQNETMQHLIAFNGFRGGNKGSASCQPLSEYDKTISLPWLHEMVLQIRGEKSIRSVDRADEAKIAKAQQRIKGQLPFRCAHYYRFLKNRRAQDNADPTAFLFQTTVDVDDKEYVDQAIERARELNCSDTIWKGMLLHLEYSARKKLHIDIRMPVGMTIEETQRAYCEALGVPYDESCISPERMIYITDKDSEIYRSKEWYGVLPMAELQIRRDAFVKRGLTIDGRASSSGFSSSNFSSSELRGKNGTLAALSEGYSPQNLNGTLAALDVGSGSTDVDGCSTDAGTQGASQWPQGQIRLNSVRNPGSKNVPIPPCNPMNENPENKKVQNKDNVQSEDNRFSGTNGDNAVSAGTAVQPAQPGDSHRVNDSHLSPAGDYQDAGGVATQDASEKNLIAFELFKEAVGLSGMDIDTVGSRHSSLLAIMSAGASRVMSEEELMKVVAKKMPSYYEERDCHQLIHDFYAKYGDSSKPFSRDVIRINATAEKAASGLVGGTVMGDAAYQLAGNHKVQSSKFNAQSNDDDEFRAQLRPYIENLCKASGLVDCPEALNLAMKLKDENAEFSRLSQNRIYENFTFRGNVIGYLKACVLYVANGLKWEPEIEEFIRWSEQYDLYCKMRFFEDSIKTASTSAEKSTSHGPSNLLQQLPDEFMYQQAVEVRQKNGLSADGTKNMLYAWAHRGYIERRKAGNKGGTSGGSSGGTPDSSYSSDCFIKLKFRKDGVVIES